MKKNNFKIILFYLVLIVGVFVLLSFLFSKNETPKVSYGDVVEYFENDQVQSFTVDEDYYLKLKIYPLKEIEVENDKGEKVKVEVADPSGEIKEVGYQIPSYIDFAARFEKYYMGEDKNPILT